MYVIMLWYDMHLQTQQYTTWTIKHHNAPHTHICTTFITIDISVPPKNYILWKILCNTCTTMYHIYIYLVGLPSTLYEIPCQCDRFDVKQLILRISHQIYWISHQIHNMSFCIMIKYRSFKKWKTKYWRNQ